MMRKTTTANAPGNQLTTIKDLDVEDADFGFSSSNTNYEEQERNDLFLEEQDIFIDGIRVLSILTREEISLDSACANTHTQSLLETESEHMDIPEYPQIANNLGNVPIIGTSTFPQTFNGVRNQAASSTSSFTAVRESTNSAAPGTSTFPPIANSFGNVATSGNSGTNEKSPPSTDLKPINGF